MSNGRTDFEATNRSDRREWRCKRGSPSQAGPIPNTLFDLVESTGGKQDKQLTVRMGMNGKTSARVEAIDNGMRIADEDLTRIFAQRVYDQEGGTRFRFARPCANG